MKRALAVVALTAAALPLALSAPALADGDSLLLTGEAAVVRDPAGDVKHTYTTVVAPRNSIDQTKSTYQRASLNNRPGTLVTVKVKNLHTKAQSTKFVQTFQPHFYWTKNDGDKTAAWATIQVDKKVLTVSETGRKVCAGARSDFNYAADTMTAFIPNSCLGGKPERAHAVTFLLNVNHTKSFALDNASAAVTY